MRTFQIFDCDENGINAEPIYTLGIEEDEDSVIEEINLERFDGKINFSRCDYPNGLDGYIVRGEIDGDPAILHYVIK